MKESVMLKKNMQSLNDKEGSKLPHGLSHVIDAHVHIFPGSIFSAIWKWFDENAWHIRYQLTTLQIFDFLLSRGVKHLIALQYAHKPGIARELNKYMSEKCRNYENRVTGMATVYPGEENAEKILREAFSSGLGGLKLHSHVQCFDINSDSMNGLYACCQANKKPIVMHIGREPKSTAYQCDPYELCSAEKFETVLKDFPDLKICIPHLGFDETEAYRKMIEKYDNLWLDTAMVISDYFQHKETIDLSTYRQERVMYGSDFPNIPYAWDRELKILQKVNISHDALTKISARNAADFFSLKL